MTDLEFIARVALLGIVPGFAIIWALNWWARRKP